MLINGVRNGINFITRMQLVGDWVYQNPWIMFYHVKRVAGMTTLACHVYNLIYCKMLTITIYHMQFKDIKV
jgi:hypothetical protein